MSDLFRYDDTYCGAASITFNEDIGSWVTERVTTFAYMFFGAQQSGRTIVRSRPFPLGHEPSDKLEEHDVLRKSI